MTVDFFDEVGTEAFQEVVACVAITVTTAQLDEAAARLRYAKDKAKIQKDLLDLLNTDVDEAETHVIELMKQAGKTKYHAEGLGKVSVIDEPYVTTPKEWSDKEAFFKWIEGKYGVDGLNKYMTVNSISLNALYKMELAEAISKGQSVAMAGIGLPSTRIKLSFTKG